MAAELEALLIKGNNEQQRLADTNAVLREEIQALRKEQESAQSKVISAIVDHTSFDSLALRAAQLASELAAAMCQWT
jgi:hypothetical protein